MTDEKRLYKAIHSNRKEEPEATFQYLYAKYRPLVSFVAAQYVKNEFDIEDITQEAFINFFNHVENVHSSIKTYLTVSAKNIAFNFLKKNKKVDYVDVDGLSYPDGDLITGERLANEKLGELIDDMKKVISEEDVKIILLHLIDDIKFDDIAVKFNQNVKTIKTKYYRALKKCKKIRGAE